ncbi:MAG: SDR family oxidoreductase [Gammaproteobacteria bacterium]|nr:SDR family oxidoreductase [Gammaproteobacteria bacterium]
MASLVTGGTGFIGKRLIDRLLDRNETVFVLVRERSLPALQQLIATRWQQKADLIQPLTGDICQPLAGISTDQLETLKSQLQRVYHLAALYDLNMSDAEADRINITGTRNVVQLCNALGCPLHHVSSIAVTGGQYRGRFTEAMFDEGQSLQHPYYRTKFDSEALVRAEAQVPFHIYRPGIVVGDSRTGEMDKLDGPYYLFPLLLMLRSLPRRLPLIGLDAGRMNLVPVDYVASALDAISHQDDLPGNCFHLVAQRDLKVCEVMNLFARSAGAPTFAALLPERLSRLLLRGVGASLRHSRYGQVTKQTFFEKTRMPASALDVLDWYTTFDAHEAEAVLQPLGITCPDPADYADTLWRYWQLNLAPKRQHKNKHHKKPRWTPEIKGKRVLITGASSGIGKALALQLARKGATVLLVARSAEKLEDVRCEIRLAGGSAFAYPCDLTVEEDVKKLITQLDAEPPVDMLVNNAGRSIRRSLSHSCDRLHDFERTMQLNYFGALRITLGLLPRMRQERNGHIIHVSSVGVPVHSPRFAAYLASKAAFDEFSRVAAGEMRQDNIHFSIIYMPLVRTSMIAPTESYKHTPALSPESAANLIVRTIQRRPARVMNGFSRSMQLLHGLTPKLGVRALNLGYRYTSGTAGRPAQGNAASDQT